MRPLVDEWIFAAGRRREECGAHSLRRTKASIIYRATGDLHPMLILLGTENENTVCHLGVDIEDALARPVDRGLAERPKNLRARNGFGRVAY